MPNPKALWIISTPSDSNPEEQLSELSNILGSDSVNGAASNLLGGGSKLGSPALIEFPDFKVS